LALPSFRVLLQQLEQLLVSGMAANRLEVGVVNEPVYHPPAFPVRKQPLEEIDRPVELSQTRVDAGDIVQGQGVLGIDGESAVGPIQSASALTKRSEAGRPRETRRGCCRDEASVRVPPAPGLLARP